MSRKHYQQQTSSAGIVVTLNDFTNFHAMLCRPHTARRCIQQFTGSILFLPNDYGSSNCHNKNNNNSHHRHHHPNLSQYEYSLAHSSKEQRTTTPSYDNTVGGLLRRFCCGERQLTVVSYYALVLLSCTGLSTLWGWTEFLVARDEEYNESNHGTERNDYDSNHDEGDGDIMIKNNNQSPQQKGIPLVVVKPHRDDQRNNKNDGTVHDQNVIVIHRASLHAINAGNHDNSHVVNEWNAGIPPTKKLQIDTVRVWNHIQNLFPDTTALYLRRRFEFEFHGLIPISVVMFHLTCNRGRLHLLEIYHIHNPILRAFARGLSNWILVGW